MLSDFSADSAKSLYGCRLIMYTENTFVILRRLLLYVVFAIGLVIVIWSVLVDLGLAYDYLFGHIDLKIFYTPDGGS